MFAAFPFVMVEMSMVGFDSTESSDCFNLNFLLMNVFCESVAGSFLHFANRCRLKPPGQFIAARDTVTI
jgi:hypothetical protein